MDFDAFFERFDSALPPTKEQMEAWDCKCFLINRQRLHISKARLIDRNLKMPKRYNDFTLPMKQAPKAAPVITTEQPELTLS